jgi:cellulose synthase/poly-beta-1,6-N-acetylglucosamine synthase-like glycosyltransferase
MKKSDFVLLGLLVVAVLYFGYDIIYLFPLLHGTGAIALNILLIASEMLAGFFSIYLYHSIFSTAEWKSAAKHTLKKTPFVTIQVPIFNETMEIVGKTLTAALAQNYPKNRYEIIVADDSTDEKKAGALKKFCSSHKIRYIHRNNRHGFKAGALNNALRASKGEVIALLDADDMPEPTFLTSSVSALYSEKDVAFVQTRNAERNDGINNVTGIGRLVRDLFFGAIMKSKDNRHLAIFCGSGGVIKKSIINELGGWPEATVTEDIDLSTMAFAKGYTSKFINPVECRGLLPPTFTGLSGQTFRWAYGTTTTLMLRWRQILKIPGVFRKIEHFLSCMTYVLGPVLVAIDLIMVTHLSLGIPIFHMYESKTVWIFGATLTLSSFFALLFVQLRDNRISIKRTVHYIFVMYGLSINFTKAVVSALFRRRFAFFRTPRHAVAKKNNYRMLGRYWMEMAIGIISLAAALYRIGDPIYTAQASWVIFFAIGFLSAPYFAFRHG